MNRNIKAIIVGMIVLISVGCSRQDSILDNNTNNSDNCTSAAMILNGSLVYENISTLYKEINEGLVPYVEVFSDLKLEEINNGVAIVERHIKENRYETLRFVITPELQKQLDDAGVSYNTEGTEFNSENLSTITIEGAKNVIVRDIDTAEEFAKTRLQLLGNEFSSNPVIGLGSANFITKIVDINKIEHNIENE